MKHVTSYCLIALACLTVTSGASAQYHWKRVLPTTADSRFFIFTALSCSGETCGAAATVVDQSKSPWSVTIIFFRSIDGGRTWVEQDPKLSVSLARHINDFQQIDSMHAIAVGDSGLFMRTSDGGQTWIRKDLTIHKLYNAHFSDPATGIAIANLDTNVYITSDSGKNWTGFVFPEYLWPIRGHSYSGGKFRVITYYAGPLYTTYDNFKTVDTSWLYPLADTVHGITDCNFGPGDDIVAYGVLWESGNNEHTIMTRSSDGGANWSELPVSDHAVRHLQVMSSLDETPIFVGGVVGFNHMLKSTDHGQSWLVDSTIVENDSSLNAYTRGSMAKIVTVTHSGAAIALFTSPFSNSSGLLLRGEPVSMRVESAEVRSLNSAVYPNPASSLLHIESFEGSVSILDPLGREYRVTRSENTLDVSGLPAGVYYITDGFARTKFVKE